MPAALLQLDNILVGRDLTIREVTIQQYFGETRRTDRASRNRRAMIEKVWAIWIAGVLHPSLPHDILLDLGLTERAAMVARTLDLFVQHRDLVDQVLTPGTRLIDVFDRLDRALLILGTPGAGKTTLLLTLARDLLIRAARDPEQPIPVVFPLSSWATQQRPLADWLVDALSDHYQVPRHIGQAWVDGDQILPLLDGLDEVASEHRAACVEAINTFRHDHGLLPLVVCSREAEYASVGLQLRLQGALGVQALTREQVESYLIQVGAPLAAIRQALYEDATLWELLDTPLMLYMATLAYAGELSEILRTQGTLAEWRQHLFATYVDRMFRRRRAITTYTRQQTECWLTWLAWQMTQHSQTGFYLDRMQPDWLPHQQHRGPMLGAGLLAGMLLALGFVRFTVQDLGLFGGLRTVLIAVVLFGFGTITAFRYPLDIRTVEMISWSWSTFRSKGFSPSIKLALCIGVLIGLNVGLGTGLLAGLLVGSSPVLIVGLLAGLSHGEIQTKTLPNEGICRSAWHALSIGLGAGLLAGIFAELFKRLGIGHGAGGGPVQLYGLLIGLLVGSIVGLRFGGFACLQHVVLRLLLCCNGSAPLNYVKFLDYAAERIFLRKIGGGYIFIHRLLQEYFAALHTERNTAANQDASYRDARSFSH
jgi:NACHT domain